MGELLLCRFKTAETPYYLENYSVNIYSLEELCYCMEQNPYLIEESLFRMGRKRTERETACGRTSALRTKGGASGAGSVAFTGKDGLLQ